MLEKLKKTFTKQTYLSKYNLVVLTWGNVSAISSDRKLIVIKPSGVVTTPCVPGRWWSLILKARLWRGGCVLFGLPTHLEIYRNLQA